MMTSRSAFFLRTTETECRGRDQIRPSPHRRRPQKDGVIWVHGVGDEGVMAFTDFGIENLSNSSKSEKATHAAQARRRRKIATLRSTPHGYGAIRGEGSVLGLEGL